MFKVRWLIIKVGTNVLTFFMNNQFSRTKILIGESSMAKLAKARVAIFGIGGVGGYVAEALSRSGIASFALTVVTIIIVTKTLIKCIVYWTRWISSKSRILKQGKK